VVQFPVTIFLFPYYQIFSLASQIILLILDFINTPQWENRSQSWASSWWISNCAYCFLL